MKHQWTPADWALLRELASAGVSSKEIAPLIGTTVQCVHRYRGQATRDIPRRCQLCRQPIPPTGQPGRRPVHCSTRCAVLMREAYTLNAAIDGRTATCLHCHGPLPRLRTRRLYCSEACNDRAWWERAMTNPEIQAARRASMRRSRRRAYRSPIRFGPFIGKLVVVDDWAGEPHLGVLQLGEWHLLLHSGFGGAPLKVEFGDVHAVTLAEHHPDVEPLPFAA